MRKELPTRERCQEIVNTTEAFYYTQRNIFGYNVELYDYHLASFGDFVNNEAWELRGLCFIQDENGDWHRNILMNKFFNLNEVSREGLLEIVLDNSKILKVSELHKFYLTNGKIKYAKDLDENDDISHWDELIEFQ